MCCTHPVVVIRGVVVRVCGRGGRRGRRGRRLYRQSVVSGFPGDHDAFPELLVDAAGVLPTLLVEAFAGAEVHLLGQLDGGWHEVRGEPSVGEPAWWVGRAMGIRLGYRRQQHRG